MSVKFGSGNKRYAVRWREKDTLNVWSNKPLYSRSAYEIRIVPTEAVKKISAIDKQVATLRRKKDRFLEAHHQKWELAGGQLKIQERKRK